MRTEVTAGYHFGGPTGALGVLVLQVVVVFGIHHLSNAHDGTLSLFKGKWIPPEYGQRDSPEPLLNGIDFGFLTAYLFFMAILYQLLPGKSVKGVRLVTGDSLMYRINGFSSAIVLFATLAIWTYMRGLQGLVYIADNALSFTTSAVVIAFLVSTVCYTRSFKPKGLLANNTGSLIHDYVMGAELNPRTRFLIFGDGEFDLKFFWELRLLPLWIILDLAFLARLYQNDYVSIPAVICTAIHAFYVLDSLWFEDAVLTTMDITTEGYGFMLIHGLVAWVPLVYSLPVRILSLHPSTGGCQVLALLTTLVGYWIFRKSNSEKHTFRANPEHPSVKHLKSMPTKRGTRLLITGWWGRARHINYLGDWLISLGCCLPSGYDFFPLSYLYPLYFIGLLSHRFKRDEEMCKEKYGDDWEKYKALVPWKVIPGVL